MGLVLSKPENEDIEVGRSNKAEAKIGGITPGTLIFKGKWEESPANILLPICLLGYWTIIFLWERSIKTIKTITPIARIKIAIIKNVDIEPVLPCSKIWASARGNSAIIPANIINETPLSTQIYGEYDEVMNMIIPMIRKTFEDEDAVMLHIKMMKGDRSQYEPDFWIFN